MHVVFFSTNKQWCGLPREDCHIPSTAQPGEKLFDLPSAVNFLNCALADALFFTSQEHDDTCRMATELIT